MQPVRRLAGVLVFALLAVGCGQTEEPPQSQEASTPAAIDASSSAAAETNSGELPFEGAFDAMQLGVTISDLSGQIVYVNAAGAEMHGYERAELLGQPASILGRAAARQTVTVQSLADVSRWKRETLNMKKSGESFPVLLMSDVIEDESGTMLGIVTLCEDISEQKQKQEE